MISRGHKTDDILEIYSLDQIEKYNEAALKNQADELKALVIGMRAAFQTDQRTFKEYLSSLLFKKEDVKNKPVKTTMKKIRAVQNLLSGWGKK